MHRLTEGDWTEGDWTEGDSEGSKGIDVALLQRDDAPGELSACSEMWVSRRAKLPQAKLPQAKVRRVRRAKLPSAKLPRAKLPCAKLPRAKLPCAKLRWAFTARWAVASLLAAACQPALPPMEVDTAPTETQATPSEPGTERWPEAFVVGPGTGAGLFFESPEGIARVGYVSEGTQVTLAGVPADGMVPIRIMEGGMIVRAYLDAERLGLLVTQRGKLGGTSVYVTEGNFVRYLAPAEDDGLARVHVSPRFGREVSLPAFEGVYPQDRLGIEVPPPAEPFEPGAPRALPDGAEVLLYDRPGGEVIATLPATDPPLVVQLVQERNDWKAIRVGTGPYLVGFTNAALLDAESLEAEPASPPRAAEEEVPMRLRHDAERPLWRVKEGTWVRYAGLKVARLERDGWAREMGRGEGDVVDVFVAVDDDIAIRGMVPLDSLVDEQQGAPAGAAPSQPSQPSQPTPPSGAAQPAGAVPAAAGANGAETEAESAAGASGAAEGSSSESTAAGTGASGSTPPPRPGASRSSRTTSDSGQSGTATP